MPFALERLLRVFRGGRPRCGLIRALFGARPLPQLFRRRAARAGNRGSVDNLDVQNVMSVTLKSLFGFRRLDFYRGE